MKKLAIAVTTLALVAGCSQQTEVPDATASRSLTIYTTMAPIHFVTRQLLGESDTIINTVPAGEDVPTFIPVRTMLMDMVNADLIILNGAGFEEWLDAVSLPDSILFDSAHPFKDEWLVYEEIVHSHGGQDDHSHEGYNGHTWLSPHYFRKQTTAIYEKLKTLLTEEEQQERNLSANFQNLYAQLTALDEKARVVLEPLRGTTLAATHPTYDYVAEAYGFTIFNVDIDPDEEEITGHIQRELEKIKQQQESTPITFLLWEEDPSEVLVEAVTGLGLTNIVFPPLDDVEDPDYISGMEDMLQQLAEILANQ